MRDNTLVARWFDEYDGLVQPIANRDLTELEGSLVGGSSRGVDQMIFRLRGKDVSGGSAVEVVRALERDDSDYRDGGGLIRQYLNWSLSRLNGCVPPRDLHLSDRLEDEPLALGYLLLLDEYGVGKIAESN